jgi:valyl-tRNA synthetase
MLIDLLAYMGESLAYRVDMNARDNFLDTAERRESILRLAKMISYTPSRNKPAEGKLKIRSVKTTQLITDHEGRNLQNKVISHQGERLILINVILRQVTVEETTVSINKNAHINVVNQDIPITGNIDVAAEIEKITAELIYTQGFLKSVQNKLSNEKFVNGAPEKVLANERQKEADALAKIATLEQSLAGLK